MYFITFLKNCRSYKYGHQTIRRIHTWIAPEGYNTGIKIYNCVTKQKEPLILKNRDLVTWYTCGPTVYDSSHIGHASCYVKLDIIQRILKKHFKFNLITCINITDIDDKIIRRANELNVDYKELTGKYEREFLFDLRSLEVEEPSILIRVTDNIARVIKFIKTLIDNNKAYKASDNSVYFNVNSVKKYGKLQNIGSQDEREKPSGHKRSILDFALWKCVKQEGEPFWESPWGKGRPGWHIECSALASQIFGSNIDIHAGGIDLRFPHHENEEAQSCAFHNVPQWVNYWIHTGHLQLNKSEKMSKSLRNTITIQDMLKNTPSHVFRMACIMSRYENNMEYSEKLMSTANNNYNTLKNFINSCDEFKNGFLKATINQDILTELVHKSVNNVHNALCDNFDTPSVIKVLNEVVSTTNSMLYNSASSDSTNGQVSVVAIRNFLLNTLETFGLNLNSNFVVSTDFNDVMNILNEFRQEVRVVGLADKNKDLLKLCDNVRESAKKCGINVKDHGKISSWSIQ